MPDLNTLIVPYVRHLCGGKTDLNNEIKYASRRFELNRFQDCQKYLVYLAPLLR